MTTKINNNKGAKRKLTPTRFFARIRSRHPSHDILRKNSSLLLPRKTVVRLGSTTEEPECEIQVNTTQAVRNSANKKLMKDCFTRNQVKTADWFIFYQDGFTQQNSENTRFTSTNLPYPIVAKHIYGSRGEGNTKLNTQAELETWMRGKTLSNYIFEKFYTFSKEYRLHVTNQGCFYTCRKMLKRDTPENNRWYMNDSNCVWIVESNADFNRPINWDAMVNESVKALNAVGLDVGAVDLKCQTNTNREGRNRETCDFIILEINSAPSFGEITTQKYLEEIPKIVNRKINNN